MPSPDAWMSASQLAEHGCLGAIETLEAKSGYMQS